MKGIFQQIQEDGDIYNGKPISEKELIQFFEDEEKRRIAFRKKIDKMESEHTKHFVDRAKELKEEIPLWLMFMTCPRMNMMNGGVFYTSREFIDKHSKWLK